MTETEKTLVKDSWSLIAGEKDLGDVGLIMFNKLFQDNSSLRSLYSFLRDDNVNDDVNGKLRSHGKGVMEVVDIAVSSIDDLRGLHPIVVDLGCRHYKYGVQKSHLQPVGKSLIYSLETSIGAGFNKDMRRSWLKFFAVLSISFSEGLDKGQHLVENDG
ncbi:hypothetical protein FSP39_012119 [Pinctada imbricata]|uniref:Globin domain-containing protein n=1 Tax=Pinctada imbricata TaxID=66713 RepID=A0AA88YBD2_PINIB|nr:hypothetical protein FSP39_012119 [Pinctada imbricata]